MKRILLMACILMAFAPMGLAVTIEWDAPTTNVNGTKLQDLKGYNVYIDGAKVGSVAASNPAPAAGDVASWTGEVADGTHEAYVTAEDLNGNESGPSNTVQFAVDATPSPPTGCRVK